MENTIIVSKIDELLEKHLSNEIYSRDEWYREVLYLKQEIINLNKNKITDKEHKQLLKVIYPKSYNNDDNNWK
jgi:hypothetical protein